MKFKCLESCGGKCCTFAWREKSRYIFLTDHDQMRLMRHTGRAVASFANYGEFDSTRFTNFKTRQWYLKAFHGACLFFKQGKCTVYEARPTQCRTFPFWPELVGNPDVIANYCPGIGQGEEIGSTLLAEQVEADYELRTRIV